MESFLLQFSTDHTKWSENQKIVKKMEQILMNLCSERDLLLLLYYFILILFDLHSEQFSPLRLLWQNTF